MAASKSYSPFGYTNLTWIYSAGTWTSSHLSPSPPARLAATMAYDPQLGGVVLFGGYNNSDSSGGTLLNDTWLFKDGAWSRVVTTNAPPVRTWPTLAYDPTLSELVLFSGLNASGACLGDTWTLANATWTHVLVPPGGPTGLCANALGYDPTYTTVLLAAGINSLGTPNTASWLFDGSGWTPLTAPGNSGNHEYGVSAWDPTTSSFVVAGGWYTSSTTNILSAPLLGQGLVGPKIVEVGQAAHFEFNVTGGVPLRSYLWTWGDGTTSLGGPNATHAFPGPGEDNVTVLVADDARNTVRANATVEVVYGPTPKCTVSSSVGDVDQAITFSGSATGGQGASNFTWAFGDGTQGSGPGQIHSYSQPGSYQVTLTATDSVGDTGFAQVTVSIYPHLAISPISLPKAEVGFSTTLVVNATGGAPPLAYNWSIDNSTASSGSFEFTEFATAGPHQINVTVRDQAEVSVSEGAVLSVAPALAVSMLGSKNVVTGAHGFWNATVTGGVRPYAVTWTFPDGSTATGTSATYSFAHPGSYQVLVRITDSAGARAFASENVSVATGSTSPGGTTLGLSPLAWAGIGVVVLLAGALAAMLLIRRRRTRRPPSGSIERRPGPVWVASSKNGQVIPERPRQGGTEREN